MSSKLVTVATYHYPSQGEPARIALNAAGIAAFIQDENLNLLGPFVGNAMGWIKLQVPDDRAAEARGALLEATPGLLWENRPAGVSISDDACLSCGQMMPAGKNRCPACGWSFLDQPIEEAEAIKEDDEE